MTPGIARKPHLSSLWQGGGAGSSRHWILAIGLHRVCRLQIHPEHKRRRCMAKTKLKKPKKLSATKPLSRSPIKG